MQNVLKWIAIPSALVALGVVMGDVGEWFEWFHDADEAHVAIEKIEPEVELLKDIAEDVVEQLDDHGRRFEAEDSEQLESDMRLLKVCLDEEDGGTQDAVRKAYCEELKSRYLDLPE